MNLLFTKMHGTGNDFIVINAELIDKEIDFNQLARKLCHRRFGIGADQLLLLMPSEKSDFGMRIFNADGTEVEMCGNGIRCLGKYIWDRELSDKKKLTIEAIGGIHYLEQDGDLIKVDMGEPITEAQKIPVALEGDIINYPVTIEDRDFNMTCVSMGNPHVVIVVNEVQNFPLHRYGPVLENNTLFPNKTNVEFIELLDARNIKMRVWERGTGETLACGTGACAASVAARLLGLTENKVTVHLPGGDLSIEWSQRNNHVFLSGPAAEVFEGTIKI
jgi:diaminopimelate epimerase